MGLNAFKMIFEAIKAWTKLVWFHFVLRLGTYLAGLVAFTFNFVFERNRPSPAKQLADSVFLSDDCGEFKPPPVSEVTALFQLYEKIIDPQFFGLENIPTDRPVLFIANHATLAIEFPLLLSRIYQEKNIYIRGTADLYHKYGPHWGIFRYGGAFDGSRESVSKLMQDKQPIIIFPGGGREVLKRRSDPKYKLFWKERIGFAKLAIKYGYTVIPVTSFGSEHMIDILADINITTLLGREMYVPIPKPPLPHEIQRIYFRIGKPIDTTPYNGDDSDDHARQVRDLAKETILEGLDFLRTVRENDKEKFRLPHIAKDVFSAITEL